MFSTTKSPWYYVPLLWSKPLERSVCGWVVDNTTLSHSDDPCPILQHNKDFVSFHSSSGILLIIINWRIPYDVRRENEVTIITNIKSMNKSFESLTSWETDQIRWHLQISGYPIPYYYQPFSTNIMTRSINISTLHLRLNKFLTHP